MCEAASRSYEPSQKEILEYAEYLGIDVKEDSDLLYMAREGLLAPLPKGWTACKSADSDELYYINAEAKKSQWEHPLDNFYKRKYLKLKKRKCKRICKEYKASKEKQHEALVQSLSAKLALAKRQSQASQEVTEKLQKLQAVKTRIEEMRHSKQIVFSPEKPQSLISTSKNFSTQLAKIRVECEKQQNHQLNEARRKNAIRLQSAKDASMQEREERQQRLTENLVKEWRNYYNNLLSEGKLALRQEQAGDLQAFEAQERSRIRRQFEESAQSDAHEIVQRVAEAKTDNALEVQKRNEQQKPEIRRGLERIFAEKKDKFLEECSEKVRLAQIAMKAFEEQLQKGREALHLREALQKAEAKRDQIEKKVETLKSELQMRTLKNEKLAGTQKLLQETILQTKKQTDLLAAQDTSHLTSEQQQYQLELDEQLQQIKQLSLVLSMRSKQISITTHSPMTRTHAYSSTPMSGANTCTTRKRFEFPSSHNPTDSAERLRGFSPSMRAYPPRNSVPSSKGRRNKTENLILDSFNEHQLTCKSQNSAQMQRDWRTIITLERDKLNLLSANLQKDIANLSEKQRRMQKKILSAEDRTRSIPRNRTVTEALGIVREGVKQLNTQIAAAQEQQSSVKRQYIVLEEMDKYVKISEDNPLLAECQQDILDDLYQNQFQAENHSVHQLAQQQINSTALTQSTKALQDKSYNRKYNDTDPCQQQESFAEQTQINHEQQSITDSDKTLELSCVSNGDDDFLREERHLPQSRVSGEYRSSALRRNEEYKRSRSTITKRVESLSYKNIIDEHRSFIDRMKRQVNSQDQYKSYDVLISKYRRRVI